MVDYASSDVFQLAGLMPADASSKYKGGELAGLGPTELKGELAGRLKKRVEDKILGGKTADSLRLGMKGYRERYYLNLFGASPGEQYCRINKFLMSSQDLLT